MLTDRTVLSRRQPSAGWCHPGSARDAQPASDAGQSMATLPREKAWSEERKLSRWWMDVVPDAIYMKDRESRFVLANVGVARLLGAAAPEDLHGKTELDFRPPELALKSIADEHALIQSGRPLLEREESVIDASGERRWMLMNKAPLWETERIVGLVGMGRDITKRKQEEEKHRLGEARLQAILDNTTAVIYLKDLQGRFVLINRQFEDLFHVTRAQVVHKTDYDLFPEAMADAFRVNDQRVLETSAPLEFEEVAPRDGELRTYLSIKFPLCDSAGMPCAVCGISTDITERRRAETKLVEANAELLEMNEELGRSEEALEWA